MLLVGDDGPGEFTYLQKEILHGAGRLKKHQHPGGTFADFCKGMRDLSGPQGGIPRFEMQVVFADFYDKFPLQDIKPFILVMVEMQGRASFFMAQRSISSL